MRPARPNVLSHAGRTVAVLAIVLGIALAGPSFAARSGQVEAPLPASVDDLFASAWSAWLGLWSPFTSWAAADTTDGSTDDGSTDDGSTDGGSGDPGGLDPGGGSGFADPDG